MTTNVDQGFSANKKIQLKKMTNQKTAATKCLSYDMYIHSIRGYEYLRRRRAKARDVPRVGRGRVP